jgi:hypothetical protein
LTIPARGSSVGLALLALGVGTIFLPSTGSHHQTPRDRWPWPSGAGVIPDTDESRPATSPIAGYGYDCWVPGARRSARKSDWRRPLSRRTRRRCLGVLAAVSEATSAHGPLAFQRQGTQSRRGNVGELWRG